MNWKLKEVYEEAEDRIRKSLHRLYINTVRQAGIIKLAIPLKHIILQNRS